MTQLDNDAIIEQSKCEELKGRSASAAFGSFILVLLFQFTTFGSKFFDPINLAISASLIILTSIRYIFSKESNLSPRLWLRYFSIVSALTAISWGCLLSYTALYFSENAQITGLIFIVCGGLIASASYSLSNSTRDFVFFQTMLLSSFLFTIYREAAFEDLRVGATLITVTFYFFLLNQRKVWNAFWQEQKLLSFELQKILDTFPGGISSVEDGKYKRVNRYLLELVGFKSEAIIGRKVGSLYPDSEFGRMINDYFSSGAEGKFQTEINLNTIKGPREHLLVIDRIGAGAKTRQVVIITIDIHELRKAEKELVRQKVNMENSAKMAALGEMSSGLAHEINNPLTIISARALQIKRAVSLEVVDAQAVTELTEQITKTVFRIAKIIKSLRTFARDADGDPSMESNIKDIITDTLTFCEARFKSHNILIDSSKIADNLVVECKPIQISQVVLNALNNSHDAIDNLEGEKWIKIETIDKPDQVDILITDCGPGIPIEIRNKIMQPFFTTKEIGKGTGLGLSLSKSFVEAHGGKLWFNYDCPNTQLVINLPKKYRAKNKLAAS